MPSKFTTYLYVCTQIHICIYAHIYIHTPKLIVYSCVSNKQLLQTFAETVPIQLYNRGRLYAMPRGPQGPNHHVTPPFKARPAVLAVCFWPFAKQNVGSLCLSELLSMLQVNRMDMEPR